LKQSASKIHESRG